MQETHAASRRAPYRVIEPRRGWVGFGLGEIWRYRELLYFRASRDIKVRYKQTILGASWAIIQPLVLMVGFTILFGRIAVVPTDGVPRPVFYYAALIPWTYFSGSVSAATSSILNAGKSIQQVYYPRAILPIASVLRGLVDLTMSLIMLLVVMLVYGVTPGPLMLLLPAFTILAGVSATAIGLWLAPLNAMYRDVGFGVGFLTSVLMFASPVIYPSSRVPEAWQTLYFLNPIAGVVEGFRWAVAGTSPPPLGPLLASVVLACMACLGGLWFFRRLEGVVVDVL